MQHLGLSRTDLYAYHAALRTANTGGVRVAVVSLDGDVLHHIDHRLVDGQVVVDGSAEVTRVLTAQFLDSHHTLNFDSDSPDDGALYADRMLQVTHVTRVDTLNVHVECVVFTGPVMHFERHGDIVSVEAHGKERLALGQLWHPLTIKKHTKKTDAIRTIMDATGEARYNLPALATRMPKARSLDRFGSPWKAARRIANSMDRQLFYTGNGVCTLRQRPTNTVFTFHEGTDADIVSPVALTNSLDNLRNVVLVVGGKPKGAKHRVRADAIAPSHHPLSPAKLGRNGQPRFLVEKIEDDSIRSVKEAQRRANRVLEDRLRSVTQATFDSVPIPHLDIGDMVACKSLDGTHVKFRLSQFTLPLGVDGDPVMSVGYLKKTGIDRKAIRS